MISLPEHPKILVVALRRIGDVLLTTPLVRSLRRAWPKAQLDILVFSDTTGILSGNPDIDHVVTMPARPSVVQSLALAARIAKRYDLAISTQGGDRPTFFAAVAGRKSVSLVGGMGLMSSFKKFLLTHGVATFANTHRVEEMLRIADAIGIARVGEIVCPAGANGPDASSHTPYAVLHPAPMFQYKRWTDTGWRQIAAELSQRGLQVVVTGGPAPEERAYLDRVLNGSVDVKRLDGKLSWPQLAALAGKAQVFVGPDTSVTHLAAATGVATIALYGPTDPRLWGPWPARGLDTPWDAAGTIQRRKNVWLVQNPQPCLPCQNEGCDRHISSHSRCLDELASTQVIAAVDQALGEGVRRSSVNA
ncbi:MAG: glycosyltransferase family 9 protein [Xanthobacteraceae bacterium]